MISITTSSIKTSTAKMTDLSVASACSLGLSVALAPIALRGTGLSGAGLPLGMSGLLMDRPEGNERPTKALEAVEGKAKGFTYGFAATSAGNQQQTTQHHTMWAFRGLEPWSDPA
ncbi:hypothetical protein [Streptomyces sp. NPDC090025]|uniref:hypothetical protein n=1 Tax=Streptomyces sp. NPDC090025 TaxID=3365922 RepID=UPI0038362BB6